MEKAKWELLKVVFGLNPGRPQGTPGAETFTRGVTLHADSNGTGPEAPGPPKRVQNTKKNPGAPHGWFSEGAMAARGDIAPSCSLHLQEPRERTAAGRGLEGMVGGGVG